jgi:aminoglycoside phosphotransferase (APT) family kinase protein
MGWGELPDEVRAAVGDAPLHFPRQGMTSDVALAGATVVKRARSPLYCDWLRAEHRVLSSLAGLGLAAPRPLVLVERGDEVWLAMERLEGAPLDLALEAAAEPGVRHALMESLGRMLRRIHDTPLPPALRCERPWLDRMLDAAAANLAAGEAEGDAALLDRLHRSRPPPVPDRLIHGDAAADNFLAHAGAVVAAIDWPLGGPGDPRYDLTLATLHAPSLDDADRAAFHAAYGAPPLPPDLLAWFNALYDFF